MNRFAHYRMTTDGQPIHYILAQGSGSSLRPLILTHGWPWTFSDFAAVIERLAHPERFGGDAEDGFDVIVPSLPGFGFSPLKGDGYGVLQLADLWNLLMTQVFGYDRYFAAGSDWGGIITAWLGYLHPDHVRAVHSTLPTAPGIEALPEEVRSAFAPNEQWMIARNEAGADKVKSHDAVHSHDPQTLAYAMADSPIGTAVWLWERRREWSDCGGDIERAFDRTALCDLASLYWLTNTTGSSFRMYSKRKHGEPIPGRRSGRPSPFPPAMRSCPATRCSVRGTPWSPWSTCNAGV